MGHTLKFFVAAPGFDRVHHVTEEDVRVVLDRLPPETWSRLRAVHFKDESRGARCLGYVRRGRREITMCSLPPRMSLGRFLIRGQSPQQFGARRGCQWPELAIRRFLLYDTFLHELGHLQVVDRDARTERRRFAMETKAEEFATSRCQQLWSQSFDHPDPVHHPPGASELLDAERYQRGSLPSSIV
jgi:hypothetical protein